MEAVREAWTDERLDDLNNRVDEGFREARLDLRSFRGEVKIDSTAIRTEVKADFVSLRTEMDARFDMVEKRFEAMERRFDAIDRRFDTMFAALAAGFIGVIVTHFVG